MIRKVKITEKYEVVLEDEVPKMILRYGEEWREIIGDKFILACINEIEELREKIKNK